MSSETRQNQMGQENSLQALYWRDEILEVMYWLWGQGLKKEITTRDLRIFLLDLDEPAIQRHLELFIEEGYIESIEVQLKQPSQVRYRLTEMGHGEAKRRFLDDFKPPLPHSSQNHDDCPPESPCHQSESH